MNCGFGPRSRISAATSARQHVGIDPAQQQRLRFQRVPLRPAVEIGFVQGELGNDVRIVMHSDPTVVGSPHRGVRHAPPERVGILAERRVIGAQPVLQFADRVETRRRADIIGDPPCRRFRNPRPDIVDDEVADPAFQRSGGQRHADQPAHRRADPAHRADAEMIEDRLGVLSIGGVGIVGSYVCRPGRESAPERVRDRPRNSCPTGRLPPRRSRGRCAPARAT